MWANVDIRHSLTFPERMLYNNSINPGTNASGQSVAIYYTTSILILVAWMTNLQFVLCFWLDVIEVAVVFFFRALLVETANDDWIVNSLEMSWELHWTIYREIHSHIWTNCCVCVCQVVEHKRKRDTLEKKKLRRETRMSCRCAKWTRIEVWGCFDSSYIYPPPTGVG